MNVQCCWRAVLSVVMLLGAAAPAEQGEWAPVKGRIQTRWAADVDPDHVLREYPRPLMVRKGWKNLNGLWDYAVTGKEEVAPATFEGRILVPFAVESALSGVGRSVDAGQALWYRRSFTIASSWRKKRVLLHFGAVDWECRVWVNGELLGTHRGGYDPFSFEVTDALLDAGPQELIVRVWDPTDQDNATQARGKQVRKPGGIFYTAVTGIWQTVWIEAVPRAYISALKIIPDIDQKRVMVKTTVVGATEGMKVKTSAKEGWFIKSRAEAQVGVTQVLALAKPKLWSPDRPYLYDLVVDLKDRRGKVVDRVKSYFGMRKIAVAEDEQGVKRLFLNNKPLFQFGPLDQGWWPDGLYTAPTDEALRYDLEVTKALGFNMLRKHVKTEPQRLYYHCDKLGLLVWQDMPSSRYRRNSVPRGDLPEIDRQWELEWQRIIDAYHNHPSIVMWIPFNEGWGQYDTERISQWTKEYDPTRLVNNASGWTDHGVGDVVDIHSYPGPLMPPLEPDRAAVLGEFGGLGWAIEDHLWQEEGGWAYRSFEDQILFERNYTDLIAQLYDLVENGLAAAVYTQTTDCEVEINGLMTYDRDIIKLEPRRFRALNRGVVPPRFADGRETFWDRHVVELTSPNPRTEIRYTTNGRDPTRHSPLYEGPIRLDHDATVKARAYWPGGGKSVVVSRSFREVATFQRAVAIDPNGLSPGLTCDLYHGRWTQLPNFRGLEAVNRVISTRMDLAQLPDERLNFALRFTGFIRLPRTQVYRFYIESDDGTRLTVGGKRVIDHDGVHGMTDASGEIALEAGWHPVELLYFQGVGGLGLAVGIEGTGHGRRHIFPSMLGH
ncbi:MAG: chitobiase/beta-hexosaminidase C-terminal domain-containing protein [Planctomycetes bacterium]|nr:chitobiase/beta-hexosaminidase C-terminal domain-containing protein [Planctomycetota bacterium]